MRVFIGASLTAVLLGCAMALSEHGQTIQAGMAAMGAATLAFVAGVFVGDRS